MTRRALEIYASGYVRELDPRLPAISPLFADLTELPPMMIQAGGAETLLGDARALEHRAREAGVEVELEVFDGTFHVFQAFATFVPEASVAIRKIGDFARRLNGP